MSACDVVTTKYTLQRHETENSKQIFPEKELRSAISTFMCLRAIYIPMIDLPIIAAGKYVDRSWKYIVYCISLTDT
jgi:hypothetical protein